MILLNCTRIQTFFFILNTVLILNDLNSKSNNLLKLIIFIIVMDCCEQNTRHIGNYDGNLGHHLGMWEGGKIIPVKFQYMENSTIFISLYHNRSHITVTVDKT